MDKLDGARQSRAAVLSVPEQLPVYDVQTDVIVPEIAGVEELSTNKMEKDLVGGKGHSIPFALC